MYRHLGFSKLLENSIEYLNGQCPKCTVRVLIVVSLAVTVKYVLIYGEFRNCYMWNTLEYRKYFNCEHLLFIYYKIVICFVNELTKHL